MAALSYTTFMDTNPSAITITNLKKHFGRGDNITKALDGVSFSVPQGEIFGFLGPNGAGKTTAIRCLMNFITPTDGTVQVFGKDVQHYGTELRQKVGYLSGYVQLYKHWTGQDHINYFGKLRGSTAASQELITKLSFNPTVKTKKLSSGNKQKLGIILALMHNPNLIVMDEPTNALDPLLQQTVYELLEQARNRGATVFMSSHNLTEVERICNRVAIIRHGKLEAEESITSLQAKRLYTVTARFHEPVEKAALALPHTEIKTFDETAISLNVKTDIKQVLAALSQMPLEDVEVQHASLEEIFLEYYHTDL